MTANNTVALTHLFEYNKYQISMFLLELLAKKVCSVSFVSQYTFCCRIDQGSVGVKLVQGGTSVVVPYCYLFLLSVFILWFSYYVSEKF